MCARTRKVASLLEPQQVVHSAKRTMTEVQGIRRGFRSSACLQNGGHPLLTTDVAQGSGAEIHITVGQSHKAQAARSQGNGIPSRCTTLGSGLDGKLLLLQQQGIGPRVQLDSIGGWSPNMCSIAIEETRSGQEWSRGLVYVVVNNLDDGILLQLPAIGHVGFSGRDQRLLAEGNAQISSRCQWSWSRGRHHDGRGKRSPCRRWRSVDGFESGRSVETYR